MSVKKSSPYAPYLLLGMRKPEIAIENNRELFDGLIKKLDAKTG